MTKAELAAKIREKYPQYRDIPDEQLVSSYVEKFPQYAKLVDAERTDIHEVSKDEPDTFWGGFGKSLKHDVLDATVNNPMLQGAAHPQTMGDFTSLLLPSGVGEVLTGIGGVARRGKDVIRDAAMEAPTLKSVPGRLLKALYKFQDASPEAKVGRDVRRFKPNVSGYEPNSFGEAADTSLGSDIEQFGPAAKGAEPSMSPSSSQRQPYNTAQDVVDLPEKGRIVGKAPTLEEELTNSLLDQMGQGDAAPLSTLPPEAGTAGGGPFKQSWSKTKQQNLGGYSSGRPGIGADDYDNLVDPNKFGGTGADDVASLETVAAPATEVPASSPRAAESLESVPDMEGPSDIDVSPSDRAPGPSTPIDDTMMELLSGPQAPTKPKLSAPEVAQALRNEYGSRDASKMLYGRGGSPAGMLPRKDAIESIQRLAPGKSQIPGAASKRILDYNIGGGEDDLLKSLLAALTGGAAGSGMLGADEQ